MAIQSFTLDPNASVITGDEIITEINSATTAITREDALSQDDLKLVKSDPASGEYAIKFLQGIGGPKLSVDYDDVPIP